MSSEPIDPTTSTRTEPAVDRSRALRMDGRRASHVATAMPVRK